MNNVYLSPDGEPGSSVGCQDALDVFWQQFKSQFPTDKDCVEELRRRIAGGGSACRFCKSHEMVREPGDRTSKCLVCGKVSWLTAGTFFNRVRLIRPWFAAIWLLERGVSLNASRLHKLVGVAYSSALSMLKKLAMIIQSQMPEGAMTVSSAHFAPIFCRRSRETPAREHPVAEQEAVERLWREDTADNHSNELSNSSTAALVLAAGSQNLSSDSESGKDSDASTPADIGARETTCLRELSQAERRVLEALSTEAIHFDSICELTDMPAGAILAALTMLELAGLVKLLPGDRYVRVISDSPVGWTEDSVSETITGAIASIVDFVHVNFQGISRKYLQNYLACYWCQIDRIRWSPGALLKECLQFRPIVYNEVRSYISPPLVKMAVFSS